MKARFGLTAVLTLIAAPLSAEPWSLPRSDVISLEAADGHDYKVMIAWPEGPAPSAGWPVLWVLDGEDNFAIAVTTARRLARAGSRSGIEPGVIVAVDSGPLARRVEDYTPFIEGYTIPAGSPAHGLPTGGATKFLDLLDARLRPFVLERLRLDPERQTLAGHSFGGLLALYAAREGRGYTAYAAISPSLWFGGDQLEPHPAPVRRDGRRRLLIAAAPGERDAGVAGTKAASHLVAAWQHEGHFARYLALPGQNHGSTMLAAMAQIITTAFGRPTEMEQ